MLIDQLKKIILYKRYTEFKIIVWKIDKGRYNLNFKKIYSISIKNVPCEQSHLESATVYN